MLKLFTSSGTLQYVTSDGVQKKANLKNKTFGPAIMAEAEEIAKKWGVKLRTRSDGGVWKKSSNDNHPDAFIFPTEGD